MPFLEIIIGSIFWRIRGGLGNSFVQKFLKKPEGWEIPNTIIRVACVTYFTLLLPLGWDAPIYFALVYVGIIPGYFGGQFNLADKGNRTWSNYLRLATRGGFTLLPALTYAVLSLSPHSYQLFGGVVAGLLLPACYLIGFMLPERKGVISHSQYGEWLYGFLISAGVVL